MNDKDTIELTQDEYKFREYMIKTTTRTEVKLDTITERLDRHSNKIRWLGGGIVFILILLTIVGAAVFGPENMLGTMPKIR